MGKEIRRTLLALTCALSFTAMLPATSGAVVVGIGSQSATFLTDPLFKALKIHDARLTVSWDVAVNKKRHFELGNDVAWLNAAAADGVKPLVSFSGPPGRAGNYIPNVRQYTKGIKAFMKKFPAVKEYTAWNEPDWVYRSLSREPLLAASYFNALAHNCHHCTLLAGDVYLPANQLTPWIKAYKKGLHVKPSGWALHNYYDVRQHKATQLKALMKLTSGPIWLDEISGVERRGHWQYKNQSAAAAARDEKFLFSLPHRYHRVARIYHYQWAGVPSAGWDSGLVDQKGNPRPAYGVIKKATGA